MRVLILCTGNSARSQMAEGLLRHDGGPGYEVFSAGTHPSHVRPEAIEVMREAGIDISGHRSKSVEEFAGQHFDYVITVCDNAKESCPVFPATTQAHSLEPGRPCRRKGLRRAKARRIPAHPRRAQRAPAPVRPGKALTGLTNIVSPLVGELGLAPFEDTLTAERRLGHSGGTESV